MCAPATAKAQCRLSYNDYVLYLHVPIYTIDLSKNQDLTGPSPVAVSKDGAGHRIRTCDPLITNEVLYQLS